jgi:tetratricopeptide (TPR) repeat protein
MVGSVYSANAERAYHARDAANARAFSEIAVGYYEKSLATKSDHYTTQHNLGWSLFRLGRVDEAIPYLEKAVQLMPSNPDGRVDLAEALYRRGRRGEAIAQLEEALRINPGHEGARRALAQVSAAATRPATGAPTQPATQPAK